MIKYPFIKKDIWRKLIQNKIKFQKTINSHSNVPNFIPKLNNISLFVYNGKYYKKSRFKSYFIKI